MTRNDKTWEDMRRHEKQWKQIATFLARRCFRTPAASVPLLHLDQLWDPLKDRDTTNDFRLGSALQVLVYIPSCVLSEFSSSLPWHYASFLFPEAQLVICYTTRVASTHSNAMSFLSPLTTFNCIVFILNACVVKPRTLSPRHLCISRSSTWHVCTCLVQLKVGEGVQTDDAEQPTDMGQVHLHLVCVDIEIDNYSMYYTVLNEMILIRFWKNMKYALTYNEIIVRSCALSEMTPLRSKVRLPWWMAFPPGSCGSRPGSCRVYKIFQTLPNKNCKIPSLGEMTAWSTSSCLHISIMHTHTHCLGL